MMRKYLNSLYPAILRIAYCVLRRHHTQYEPVPQVRNLMILLIFTVWLAACSNASGNTLPDSTTLGKGDAEAGQTVFAENGCVACHAVTSDAPPGIGPSLAGVAGRSQETIQNPDYSGAAETVDAYLWESITNPSVYMAQAHSTTMPNTYQQSLEEQEIADLVAYLLTLN
jgi:nitric oxide reductase subunit C